MNLKQRISEDMKSALKGGEKLRVGVLRMLNARILEREVELRSSRGRDYHLSDAEVIEVLAGYAKQRRQSIESYRQGGREDLAQREEAELALVQAYLPKPLSAAELTALVDRAIAETGASGLKDLGLVMKQVMAQVRGAAEGKEVSQVVKERLLASQ
ncbi:MAG: GatB/YqeY domain-containing protein [Acidobacteriota bacterium]